MSRVTVDAATRARLHNLDGFLVLSDEASRTLGYFNPAVPPDQPADETITSPVSDEEIEELRKQRTGRPLSEILKDLGAI